VTPSEVAAFAEIVQVPDADRAKVERLFDLAKATTSGFEAYARQVVQAFAGEDALLEDVLDGLFHIAKADGALHAAELDYLREVATIFGLDEGAFARLCARHLRLADDPYGVLGAERDMSDAELKALHRARVAEAHPDRAVARGLPPAAVAIATRRLAGINAAWDRIRAERGL
jgi:DnaJ like chaperone protein